MIDFEFDSATINQLALNVAATEGQTRKALRTTLNKMAAWLRVRSVKGLSKSLEIQQKIVRRRLKTVKFKETADGGVAKVWYGLNPVAMIYLGAKKAPGGVSASGNRFVKGAFIAKGRGKSTSMQVFKRVGKARLPLQREEAAIQKTASDYLEGGVLKNAEFEAQFWKTFEHELKWRTQ